MTQIKGFYYDGNTSAREEVSLEADSICVHIRGNSVDIRYSLNSLVISPPLGKTRRIISFPDKSSCELDDNPGLNVWLKDLSGSRSQIFLHRWENSLKYAFLAVILTIASIWGIVEYGIPVMAKHVAYALPPETEVVMGNEAIETLDKIIFKPSELSSEKQQLLIDYFADSINNGSDSKKYRIEFRKLPESIGANAFTLPSGIIIFTDAMIKLAKNNDELLAVLAHEIGHVEHRHIIRHVLHDSAIVLILTFVTGDILSSGSFAVVLPTLLVQAKFSKSFETEADIFAVQFLESRNVSPQHLGRVLTRLAEDKSREGEVEGEGNDFLSTHPGLKDRIKNINNASSIPE